MDWFSEKDNEHLEGLASLPSDAGEALALAGATVAHLAIPLSRLAIPSDALFPNAAAGTACFSLSHRLLRASLLLLHFGYYEAVPPLLRSAYEAAECGQLLSKSPEAAERWIGRDTNWPRKEVRERLGDVTRGEEYGRHYGLLSVLSHPTAKSGMWCTELDEDAFRPLLAREVSPRDIRIGGLWLASVAVFTCFALRNAMPGDSLEPRWVQALGHLAREVSSHAGEEDADWSHLDRDWEASQARWERVTERLQSNKDLERLLDEHPSSWQRAQRDAEEDADPKQ